MAQSVEDIIAQVLRLKRQDIAEDSGPRRLRGWDSLNHLRIILALEAEFGIKVPPKDYARTVSVAALRGLVAERRAAAEDAAPAAGA